MTMPPHANAVPLRPRKQVCLRAKPNLHSESRFERGRRVHVVKDPVTLQYFHLEEPQFFALRRMDGRHTLDQIQQQFERDFKPQRLPLAELEAFARQLLHAGLVENESSSNGRLLLDRLEKHERQQRWLALAKVFYFKIPLIQPAKILDKLAPLGRILFHPLFVLAAAALLVAALALILTRWCEFVGRLPSLHEMCTWRHLVYLWLAVGVVKILHELGHALCARTVGAEVQEMGVVFMFLFPALYCNVTDSWMLPQKWRRMAISAAGIYVELLLASLATLLWWTTDSSTFLHDFSLWMIVVCSVHTVLFNANPLMRFDGYFILSDWLEIANLSQAAQRRCLTGVLRWLGIAVPENHAPGPNRFLLLYGMASFFYRLVVVGCLLYAFYQFLKWQRLEWLGFALVTVALFILAALPAYRLCRAVQQIGKVPEMKRSRVLLLAAFVGSAAAVVFLVPFRMSVHAVGLVQVDPAHQQRVVIPASGGILAQTMVRDGQRVQQGDIIAVLRNPNLELDLRLNDAEQALRGEQRQAVLSQLALFDGASSESASLAEIEQDSRTLAQQNAALKARAAALVLRAPCDGLVIGLPSWDVQGKWLAAGTTLCQIGNDSHLRLLALLEPADRQLVDANKSARLHCPCGGAAIWNGSVVSVAQVDAQEIPPQLSHRVGGDIVTTQDPVSKAEKPNKQHYLVAVRLDRADPRLQVGALGQVRIDAGASTLWWRLRKYLGSTFNWGL